MGNHYDVGVRLGKRFREHILAGVRDAFDNPPQKFSQAEVSSACISAWYLTQQAYPKVADECAGMAEGAGVSPLDFIRAIYEDLWDHDEDEPDTGCTDIAASGKATANGLSLVGHNNDEDPNAPPPHLIRVRPTDGPVVTGVALGGFGFSIGVNSFGLVLTGNQLTATDIRPGGIPRLLLVRALLEMPTIEDAVQVMLDGRRASSYNNVLADAHGRVVMVEGSGTKGQIIKPTEAGILTHTNHYLTPKMQPVEFDGSTSTRKRERRSCQMMTQWSGHHTPDTFRSVLTNHEDGVESICRHDDDVVTGFSVIIEPERRVLWYCKGYPCQGIYKPCSY